MNVSSELSEVSNEWSQSKRKKKSNIIFSFIGTKIA